MDWFWLVWAVRVGNCGSGVEFREVRIFRIICYQFGTSQLGYIIFPYQTTMNSPQSNTQHSQQTRLLRNYVVVPYEMRKTLIQKVEEEGYSIRQAAKLLDINQSTAKAILRVYRRNKRIYKPKKAFRRKHTLQPQEKNEAEVEPVQLQEEEVQKNCAMWMGEQGEEVPQFEDVQVVICPVYFYSAFGWECAGTSAGVQPFYYLM